MNSNTTLSNKRDEIFTLYWDLNNETKCDENILYYTKWYRDAMQEYAEWYHEAKSDANAQMLDILNKETDGIERALYIKEAIDGFLDKQEEDLLKEIRQWPAGFISLINNTKTQPISHDLSNTNTSTPSDQDDIAIGFI
jgi:hypothetical protein